MGFDLGNLLQQYLGGNNNQQANQAENDFDRVAQNSPLDALAHGVTQALRSDQTPPFPQMVSQLFGNSNPDQRAGMLNQLIAGLGPGALASLAGGALAKLTGGQSQVTPDQAAQLSPQQVQDIAAQAEQQNPGIVDRMGAFYAAHPTLIKTVGGAALAVALGYMAQGLQKRNDNGNTTPTASNDKGANMGILGDIFHKIFPSKHPANTPAATPAPAGAAPAAPAAPAGVPGTPQAVPAPAPAPAASVPQVDVEQVLATMQQQSGQQLNWRSSIVDLLKLLGLDSSLQARKELAAELHYTGDTNDSASMNIWLHRQVMNKLAANGGKVPADLKD